MSKEIYYRGWNIFFDGFGYWIEAPSGNRGTRRFSELGEVKAIIDFALDGRA